MSRKDYFVKVPKAHAAKVKGEKHGNLILDFTEDVNGDPYTSIDAIREAPSAFEGVKIEFTHKDNIMLPVIEYDENGDPIPPVKQFVRTEEEEVEPEVAPSVVNEQIIIKEEVKLTLWQKIKLFFKNIF